MSHPDPIAFTIFNIDVRWYGILIAGAMILAGYISSKRSYTHNLCPDQILSYLIFCIPGAIIGARAYYVIFQWDYYGQHLDQVLNFRGGGLAIHGGLIGAFVVAYFVAKHMKVSLLDSMDLTVPTIALAQAIGRWGNFFNGEAHGGPTDLPWGIMVGGEKVHPTFLYESLWCLALFAILMVVNKNRTFLGQTITVYGILYSLERIAVEALRTDSLMIGPFKQAQVFSLSIIVVCAVLYAIFRSKYKLDYEEYNAVKISGKYSEQEMKNYERKTAGKPVRKDIKQPK